MAPNVTLSPCELAMNVTWRPWSPILDTGDPPVAQYRLEYTSDEGKTWQIAAKLNTTLHKTLYHYKMSVTKLCQYSFRLLVFRLDNDKLRPSIAGPASSPVIACSSE